MLSLLEKITIMKLIRDKSMHSTFGLIIKEDMLNEILNGYTRADKESRQTMFYEL